MLLLYHLNGIVLIREKEKKICWLQFVCNVRTINTTVTPRNIYNFYEESFCANWLIAVCNKFQTMPIFVVKSFKVQD